MLKADNIPKVQKDQTVERHPELQEHNYETKEDVHLFMIHHKTERNEIFHRHDYHFDNKN